MKKTKKQTFFHNTYQEESLIGEGSYGKVYKAKNVKKKSSEVYAIKNIKVEKSKLVNQKNSDLHSINNIVLDSVEAAHFKGDVPCNLITIDEVNEYNIGKLMYFFMMSAAFSSLLFEVDPFNQPGVEVYKQEVRDNLKLDQVK